MNWKTINKEYIELIKSNQNRYIKDYKLAIEKVANSTAKYKGKPVPFLYHPMFYTEKDVENFNKMVDILISITNKVTQRYLDSKEFRKKFGYSQLLEELILVDNGYDVGNHTNNHDSLSGTSVDKTQQTIAQIYQKLDAVIPGKYVNIIALPYGNPTNKRHSNFSYILNGTSNGYTYQNKATLRVGWEPDVSPFNKNFDKTYIKRCRAYDNNGSEFDIRMVFNMLKNSKYISDGLTDIITIPSSRAGEMMETDKRIVQY